MNLKKSLAGSIATATILWLVAATASATVISQDVSFGSQNQSMWKTGTAYQLNQNQFIGATWNKSVKAGPGFTGGTTQVINPAWVLWHLCFINCGSAPAHYLSVNTKTGLQVSASTSGKVGFNVGLTVDSGSVNALTNFNPQINVPDAGTVSAGDLVNFNTSGATLTGGGLNSQFPTMSASLSAVLQVSANFAATGCLTGSCGTASYSTGTLGGTLPLVAFNQDGEGGITYFGGSGPLSDALNVAVNAGLVNLPSGFPATLNIPAPEGIPGISSSLGSITAYLPQPNVTGAVDPSGTKITGTAADNLIDFNADVSNLISIGTTGVPGLFDGSVDMGSGFGVDYNLAKVTMGPTIDLRQTFDLTPTLYVDLQFSQPVNVTGLGTVTSASHLNWNNLPTMSFMNGDTTITPTFYLGTDIGGTFMKNAGDLLNQLMLDVGGNITVNLLNATFNTPFGSQTLGLPTLLDQSFNLFTTPPIFSKEFAMAGFSPVLGSSFDIQTKVPEPGTLALLGGGLLILVAGTRRRKKA